MVDVWKSEFNIGNYFMPITIKQAAAATNVSYRRKVICITKAITDATEGFIEVNAKEDIADYTDNTEVEALFDAGMEQVYLCNVAQANLDDINDILEDNITKYFTIAITSDLTDEEKATYVDVPSTFNGGVITNFTDQALAISFAGGTNQGSSCDKDLYNFLLMVGKCLVNQAGFYNNYGATISEVGYLKTSPTDYLSNYLSFIISNTTTGVNRIGGLFLGGRPFTTPYILDEIKVGLQDTWMAYRARNNMISSSPLNCKLTETELNDFMADYVQTEDNPSLPLSSASIDVSESLTSDFAFNCEIEISKITDIIQLITTLSEV